MKTAGSIIPNTLDWTGAWNGRVSSGDSMPYEVRRGDMATRLISEITAGRLPFINMPFREELETSLEAYTPWLQSFRHMLLLGIGGSALGARALQKAFYPQQDRPEHAGRSLWIADNVDADTLDAWFDLLPPEKTLVVVISKSGGTIETLSQYFLARQWLRESLGDAWKKHVMVITDAAKGYLRQEADVLGLASLPVPDHLGGRYSVLSAVGMVPAAFLDMDWKALLRGALDVGAPLYAPGAGVKTLETHPAWKLAVWNRTLMDHGYTQLIFFSYIPLWAQFGFWFTQLWAESLGKEGKGSMPLPAVGVTDQHSTQQMFLDGPRDKACLLLSSPGLSRGRQFGPDLPEEWAYLRGAHFGDLLQAEGLGTQMALYKAGTPLVEMCMGSTGEEAAGRLMALLGIATVLTGWLLDINPLDQPAVELGKRLANARLGASGYDEESADLEAFLARAPEQQEF